MTEDDTFKKLKQIPWKEAVKVIMNSRTPGFDSSKPYERQVPIIIEHLTKAAQDMGWNIEDFMDITSTGIPMYNNRAMNTYNGR